MNSIKRMSLYDVDNNTNEFCRLITKVYSINFPDVLFDDSFGRKKIDDLKTYLADGTAIIYASMENDTIQGFIWGYCREVNGKKRLHIPLLVVADGFERRGLATALMHEMKNFSIMNSLSIMEVMVSSDNESALMYYKRLGFIEKRKLLEMKTGTDAF